MLVFASDIHLTDGTSGETIAAGAFRKFVLYLKDMVETAGADRVEVVFLGDIFDVIRSDFWLESEIRPWSRPAERDGTGRTLEDYTSEIVRRICANRPNRASMRHLKSFKKRMAAKGVQVSYSYVIGNHDWLINRYADTRQAIAQFLGMEHPEQYASQRFPTEGFWAKYRTFARHGDMYDPFNYDGDRDASSLGDAIVIDLINRFPEQVRNRIGPATAPKLVEQLEEIDNVRPLIDVPLWVQGVCATAPKRIAEKVKDVWNDLVDDFLSNPFVRAHDKPWRADVVDLLQAGLGISKFLRTRALAGLVSRGLRRLVPKERDYWRDAHGEKRMQSDEAEFVVYGHTHSHTIRPLERVARRSGDLRKMYFNTGTWRKVHAATAFDKDSYKFIGWHVMTFIAFYLPKERQGPHKEPRRFEVWNGALG